MSKAHQKKYHDWIKNIRISGLIQAFKSLKCEIITLCSTVLNVTRKISEQYCQEELSEAYKCSGDYIAWWCRRIQQSSSKWVKNKRPYLYCSHRGLVQVQIVCEIFYLGEPPRVPRAHPTNMSIHEKWQQIRSLILTTASTSL